MTDLTLLGAEKNWISKLTRDIFFQALLRILSSLWIFQVGLLCSLILTPKNGPKIFDWFESRAISRPHTIPLEVWNLFLDQSLSPESSVSPSSNPHKKKSFDMSGTTFFWKMEPFLAVFFILLKKNSSSIWVLFSPGQQIVLGAQIGGRWGQRCPSVLKP